MGSLLQALALQLVPLPEYPALHEQEKPPAVFVHVALA
jgi:hypothetical protein